MQYLKCCFSSKELNVLKMNILEVFVINVSNRTTSSKSQWSIIKTFINGKKGSYHFSSINDKFGTHFAEKIYIYHDQGLFQALKFPNFAVQKIEFYGQYLFSLVTLEAPPRWLMKGWKNLRFETRNITGKGTSGVKSTENISLFEVLSQWMYQKQHFDNCNAI